MAEINSERSLRGTYRLQGLMPVVPTPLTEEEQIDAGGIEKMAEFLLQFPFCGIWALASAGEDENLSLEKIEGCTRLFVKHFGGKVPVLVLASRPGTRDTLERVRRFADLGIDAAVVLMEQQGLGPAQHKQFFETVLEDSPVPIVVYNNESRGASLGDEFLLELTRHPKCVAMKAGGSNLSQLQKLCLFADQGFSVFTAGGGQLMAGLAMGASGHTAIPLSAFPEIAFSIYEHVQAGRLEQARAEQQRLSEFLLRMPKLGNREVNGETKCVLEVRGVLQRHVSGPFIAATDEQKAEIERLSEELEMFKARI